MKHFVIIGAGECGVRAAFALREKGFEGEVTLIGAEPVTPYERPPLSKAGLADGAEPKFIARFEQYSEQDIRLLTGVTALELEATARNVKLSDGSRLSYDKLLLATGASARSFPGTSENSARIRSLRTHRDAMTLRRVLKPGSHIVIVGGGFIGLEVAATARQLGAEVTVIEGLERVLKRGVPTEIADLVTARHRSEGVVIRCGVSIEAITERDNKASVQLTAGEIVEADLVVVGIGAQPNVDLAAKAGLAVDNGIAVDSHLRTSATEIFAAGDCCSFPYGGRRIRLESWRNAQEQGEIAAANMMGADEIVSSVPWFWSEQYELTLQVTGLADSAVTHLKRDLSNGAFILFHLDVDGRLVAASGVGLGNTVAREIRVAEMLIAARARPASAALTASDVKLKSLLASLG